MEVLCVILSGLMAFLFTIAFQLWARVRLMESAMAALAPVHALEALQKKHDHLEQQAAVGFSKTAEALANVVTANTLTLQALEGFRAEVEDEFLRKSEVN